MPDQGWILPDGTYVQTIGDDTAPDADAIKVGIRPEAYYDYVGGSWVLNPDREFATLAPLMRNERDVKLATEVDPVVSNPLRWSAMTADQQQAWIDYRQALLDVPSQVGFPRDIVWPTTPSEAAA